jgi:hypothetical protein
MGGELQGDGCLSTEDGRLSKGDVWLRGRWVVKLSTCLRATAALLVRIQTSLKNTNMGDIQYAKEWPTHFSPPKNYRKIIYYWAKNYCDSRCLIFSNQEES